MLWARAEDGTSIFLILWEFEVKPGCEQSFESAYGPDGTWMRLFRRDSGYLDTLLLFWHSKLAFDSFLEANREDYQALDRLTEHFTSRQEHLGSYKRSEPANSSS